MNRFCNKLHLLLGRTLAKAKVNKHNKALKLKNWVLYVEETTYLKSSAHCEQDRLTDERLLKELYTYRL